MRDPEAAQPAPGWSGCRYALGVAALFGALGDSGGCRAPSPSAPEVEAAVQRNHVVEIRSYNLKTGTRERFHARFVAEALPLLQRHAIDVVAYGPSLHDPDSYFLMRAYPSLEARQVSEDAFYGSDEWRTGPREAVLADIDSYTTVVVVLDDEAVRGLRKLIRQ